MTPCGGPPPADDGLVRLHVLLARAGVGSRRGMEAAIRAGRVCVDGVTVTRLGVRVDPARAVVTLDGRAVDGAGADAAAVVALHKPPGVISTARDPQGRPTVLDLLPAALRRVRLYPVGRLDRQSEGLVLLTNDGALAHRLTHPRFGHEREYVVDVTGRPPRGLAQRFARGVDIGGARPARAEVRGLQPRANGARLRLVLREGRNRQIRRMCGALGLHVVRLRRVRMAAVHLGSLPPGAARELDAAEIAALRTAL